MVAEMNRLLEDYNYADMARILNERFQNRRRFAADIDSAGLGSKDLRTEEPLQSAAPTR
jgi:hypothetical protein